MARLSENKIILITRKTRLDDLIARFNTQAQAKFYVEHLGGDFSDYQREHDIYYQMVSQASLALRDLGRLQIVDRAFLPNFIFGKEDTIVVLGQDGLVANTLKYLEGQPVVGVNPDPARWEGILLPFKVADLPLLMPEIFSQKRKFKEITMARTDLNNGQTLHAVNDFYIGMKTHLSARYLIRIGSAQEQHSSSGIIVSTGLGSTGWFKSVIAGAVGVTKSLTQKPLNVSVVGRFGWEADFLYYTVREPFPSKTSQANLVFGKLTKKEPMILVSQMPENGVIFSDGIEMDYLEFNSGTHATVSVAKKKGHLVI